MFSEHEIGVQDRRAGRLTSVALDTLRGRSRGCAEASPPTREVWLRARQSGMWVAPTDLLYNWNVERRCESEHIVAPEPATSVARRRQGPHRPRLPHNLRVRGLTGSLSTHCWPRFRSALRPLRDGPLLGAVRVVEMASVAPGPALGRHDAVRSS